MSDTANVAAPRSWHVSERLIDGQPSIADVTDARDTRERVSAPPGSSVERAVLPPLWKRIVTGRSLGWRIRRLRRAVRNVLRRAVSRLLRWLQRNPEVVRSLESGRLVEAMRATRRSFSSSTVVKGLDRAESIEIRVDLDGVASSHPLLRPVRLVPDANGGENAIRIRPTVDGAAEPTLVLGRDRSIVVHRGEDRVALLAPLDITRWNPIGFPQRAAAGPVALEEILRDGRPAGVHRRLARARRAECVRCHVYGSGSSAVVAARIVDLAAAGVAIVGQLPADVAALLGEPLTSTITAGDSARMSDARERELQSVRLRRIAQSEFSVAGRWRTIGDLLDVRMGSTPSVSVLLASNRPTDVVFAARQVASQVDVDTQLIVGLHGAHMPARLSDEIRTAFPGDVHVEHFPEDLVLGEVLAALTAKAAGEYVTKWDDDDWYGADHLADLIRAHRYSGAVLVGKAAEFVRLDDLDITIRRWAHGSETYSTTIAGGTLLTPREALQEVGWAPVPRQVDRRLIDAVADRGWPIYRTHGFGYVLRRRQASRSLHTWQASDSYFLRASVDQWPGLALAEAEVAIDAAGES